MASSTDLTGGAAHTLWGQLIALALVVFGFWTLIAWFWRTVSADHGGFDPEGWRDIPTYDPEGWREL